jgi:hypothetical protein
MYLSQELKLYHAKFIKKSIEQNLIYYWSDFK